MTEIAVVEITELLESAVKELTSAGISIAFSEGFKFQPFEGAYVEYSIPDRFDAQLSIDIVYGDFFEILDWESGERIYSDHVPKMTEEIFAKWKEKMIELAKK